MHRLIGRNSIWVVIMVFFVAACGSDSNDQQIPANESTNVEHPSWTELEGTDQLPEIVVPENSYLIGNISLDQANSINVAHQSIVPLPDTSGETSTDLEFKPESLESVVTSSTEEPPVAPAIPGPSNPENAATTESINAPTENSQPAIDIGSDQAPDDEVEGNNSDVTTVENSDIDISNAASAIEPQEESNDTSVDVAPIEYSYRQFNDLASFPGAQGFGSKTKAGRGGELCIVTNTNGEGPGSLRSCVERTGPRIVVFKTGGTIEVDRSIDIENPHISIYGQSAPGDGIMLRASLDSSDAPLTVKTHDVLIQHLRVRAGTSHKITCCRDAIQIGNSAPGTVYNVVIDHNSFSWGTDEIFDIWFDSHDITISNNIIAEGLFDNGSNDDGPAGRGLLVGSNGAHSISIHHNYLAHNYERNPLIKTSGIVDVTNNLIYHWVSRGGQHDTSYASGKVNWVKNKYIALPLLEDSQKTRHYWGDILITVRNGNKAQLYLDDNRGYYRSSNSENEWSLVKTDWNLPYSTSLDYVSSIKFPAPAVTEYEPDELEAVLLPHVGATSPKRDSVDSRIINQVNQNVGVMPNCVSKDDRPGDSRCNVNVGGWPVMDTGNPYLDTDNDGIPDDWERQHGLNPKTADSLLDSNQDGFLNLEDWVYDISN